MNQKDFALSTDVRMVENLSKTELVTKSGGMEVDGNIYLLQAVFLNRRTPIETPFLYRLLFHQVFFSLLQFPFPFILPLPSSTLPLPPSKPLLFPSYPFLVPLPFPVIPSFQPQGNIHRMMNK